MYCDRSQKTSQRGKNNSHATRLHLVSYFFYLCTLRRHLWLYYSTHTWENVIYLLNTNLMPLTITCTKNKSEKYYFKSLISHLENKRKATGKNICERYSKTWMMVSLIWHTPSRYGCTKATHRRPSFPWQVLFARVYDINWQVSPWQGTLFKSCHDQLLNKAPCQGKTCQFMSYTRANKTCQGKLVQLYTQAIKTCQGKLLEKSCSSYTRTRKAANCQGTCQGKLGRVCGA